MLSKLKQTQTVGETGWLARSLAACCITAMPSRIGVEIVVLINVHANTIIAVSSIASVMISVIDAVLILSNNRHNQVDHGSELETRETTGSPSDCTFPLNVLRAPGVRNHQLPYSCLGIKRATTERTTDKKQRVFFSFVYYSGTWISLWLDCSAAENLSGDSAVSGFMESSSSSTSLRVAASKRFSIRYPRVDLNEYGTAVFPVCCSATDRPQRNAPATRRRTPQ